MSLYGEWMEYAQADRLPKDRDAFWSEYFDEEKELYQKLLTEHNTVHSGSVASLAEDFGWDKKRFIGFLDGINSSLTNELELDSLTEDSEISLDIDFEKLLFNMHEAKAPWLYELPEWDAVLPAERRAEIYRDWKASKIFVADKKVGPNDPCPCGSGKKYKKCCGRLAE